MQIKDLSKELNITNKELIDFFKENDYEVKNHMNVVNDEMAELARGVYNTVIEDEPKKNEPKQFAQTDLILCRSVCAGWLGMPGKSGQLYVFANIGDEQEVEYQDLMALKLSKSRYLYDPLILIENDDLLANPRWKDISEFYTEKVYGMDSIEEILNLPLESFKSVLKQLPMGFTKALTVEVSQRIENGTFDSLKKINIIDEVCGTDFRHTMPLDD